MRRPYALLAAAAALLVTAGTGSRVTAQPIPRASAEALAIAAVQAHKPAGKTTIGEWSAMATLAASLLGGFTPIGWAAEAEGAVWRVTFVYIGKAGLERQAQWRVTLDTRTVTPTNDSAREIEQIITTHVDGAPKP
jgi:hypothetical protein